MPCMFLFFRSHLRHSCPSWNGMSVDGMALCNHGLETFACHCNLLMLWVITVILLWRRQQRYLGLGIASVILTFDLNTQISLLLATTLRVRWSVQLVKYLDDSVGFLQQHICGVSVSVAALVWWFRFTLSRACGRCKALNRLASSGLQILFGNYR